MKREPAAPVDSPLKEEAGARQGAGDRLLPIGARWTTFFLDFMVFLLLVPLSAGAFACLGSVTFVVHDRGSPLMSLGMPVLALVAFQILLLMAMGATWLAECMRVRATGRGHARDSYWNQHPPRMFLSPVLAIGEVFSAACLIVWLGAKLGGVGQPLWAWLFIWLFIGATSSTLRIWIARRFPERPTG